MDAKYSKTKDTLVSIVKTTVSNHRYLLLNLTLSDVVVDHFTFACKTFFQAVSLYSSLLTLRFVLLSMDEGSYVE
jgi:uncharacterized membrane protein